MIAFIRGVLAEAGENTVIIDSNGIGYELTVPSSVLPMLPGTGNEVKLHTYLQVREDGISLFGFADSEDLQVFKMLIGVNGIGPKAAIGILSSLSADNLRFAVLAEDEKTLAKAPGIGAKTAKKLILELKDKFRLEEVFEKKLLKTGKQQAAQAEEGAQAGTGHGAQEEAIYEAIQALTALGFSSTEASKAVNAVEVSEGMSSDEVLKQALKNMHN